MRSANRSFISLTRLVARRFRRGEGGATAIEFAILAPVFFAIIGAAMETALVFFAGQMLDSAVHDTSRLIRTGQAQQQGMSSAQYKQALCGRLHGMFDCDGLRVSVRQIDAFSDFSTGSAPIDPDSGDWTINEPFVPGTGTDTVVVEAYYKWPTIITIPGLMAGVTADGKRLLSATRVFRNEPFS